MTMFRDIRWRIAIPYTILILVVLGALTIYLSRTARNAQLDVLRNSLLVQARTLSAEIVGTIDGLSGEAADRLAKDWSELLDARVTIIGADGLVLSESDEDRTQMDNHLHRPEVQQAFSTGQGSSIRFSRTLGTDMMYAAVPVQENGNDIAVARVAVPLAQIESTIGEIQQVFLLAALVASVAAVVVAVIIAGRTSRSLRRLTEVANRMAEGDLDARLHLAPRDDLGDLTRAFNEMGDRLRDQVDDLADQRGRLAAVLDNMADGVLISDGAGLVSLINPAATRLLGTSEKAALGQSFAQVARHHELIEPWQLSFSQRQEQVTAVELGRQGTFVQMIVSPLETVEGQGCLVILQDLTRMRRLETIRRDFISNISHELRTPLASLKALVETLRDGAVEDPPAAQRFLDHAEHEVDALTQMVEELLELTRIESGMVPLQLSPTPVSDLVYPAVDRFIRQAERNGQSLEVNIAEDLPLVMADASRVQQVIGNLVHNALKFTDEGGLVAVTAKSDKKDPVIVFSVQDAGSGISAVDLPRIFERFYKSDQARSGGGTGLGLAIAKHIAQAHRGRIWATSKPGKGSTFFFTLPIAKDAAVDSE